VEGYQEVSEPFSFARFSMVSFSTRLSFPSPLLRFSPLPFVPLPSSGRILIYTFPRASTTVPTSLLTSTSTTSQTIDPSTWNLTPQANFSIPSCPSKTFNNHVIVFNVALCGDLAANTFAGSGCAGTSGISCENFVKGSPGAFGEAYWDVRSLRVYNTDGKVPSNG